MNDPSKKNKGIDDHVTQYALPKQIDEFRRRDITISDGLVKFHYERLVNLYRSAIFEAKREGQDTKKVKIRTYFNKNGYLMIKKL